MMALYAVSVGSDPDQRAAQRLVPRVCSLLSLTVKVPYRHVSLYHQLLEFSDGCEIPSNHSCCHAIPFTGSAMGGSH